MICLQYLDPFFKKNGWNIPNKEWGENLADLIGPSMILINDGIDQAKPFFEEPKLNEDGKKQLGMEKVKLILQFILKELEEIDSPFISEEQARELLNQTTKNFNVKKGLVMKSLRAALFGTLNGPDLIKSWVLLSRFSKDRMRISRFI